MTNINIRNISFGYKKDNKILNNISINFKGNETIGIIGNNGVGKTTLGKLIVGMLSYEEGQMFIDNKEVKEHQLWEIGRKIGYLFQNPSKQLFAETVFDEVAFPLRLRKIEHTKIEEICNSILKKLNLYNKKEQNCFSLSQGEKKRLALAAILVNETDYLIFDEPTSELDKENINNLKNIIMDLKAKEKGILIISHNYTFLNDVCDRVLLMKNSGEFESYNIKEQGDLL